MKRIYAVVAALIMAAIIVPATPAHAAPIEFNVSSEYGHSYGTVTFYNRSVGIQGRVRDQSVTPGHYTQVRFNFYIDVNASAPWDTQTRTASYRDFTDFNFTQEGPQGGIRKVEIRMCSSAGSLTCRTAWAYRP